MSSRSLTSNRSYKWQKSFKTSIFKQIGYKSHFCINYKPINHILDFFLRIPFFHVSTSILRSVFSIFYDFMAKSILSKSDFLYQWILVLNWRESLRCTRIGKSNFEFPTSYSTIHYGTRTDFVLFVSISTLK